MSSTATDSVNATQMTCDYPGAESPLASEKKHSFASQSWMQMMEIDASFTFLILTIDLIYK